MRHEIEVSAGVDQAYALCLRVERWPGIFPPCKAAKVIEQNDRSQLIEISALVNGHLMSWRSRRELDPEARVITSEVVRPPPLLDRMEVAWRFFQTRTGTLVVLEHRFSVKEDVRGLVAGVSTPAEARAFMERSTDENSKRELLAIKLALEASAHAGRRGELSGEFEEEMTIAGPAESVYGLLERVREWPALLPHCRAVEVRYDDGQDQEFVMTVDVRGRDEHLRSIRRCTPTSRITYFQPEPPPVLRRHSGEWLVEPSPGGGVRVVSRHGVELRPEGVKQVWGDITAREALERVTRAINENSRSTMLAIKARVESRK
ncbi:aromatase/cyclase [Sorangium sp. So ce296]|uniref:aromatase/cyclase n=1 Tax=Sorangium sp. So ce296 TaxID=3133296 RepID=UPI003F5D67E5